MAVLLTALSLGLTAAGCSINAGQAPARVGDTAPAFQLQNLEGQSVSLQSLRGKPVLINFWTSSCGPCIQEMPYLQEIYEDWSEKGLALLAINVGDSPSTIKEFLQSHQLSLPVLLDGEGYVSFKYNVFAFPVTFFIDKEGVISRKVMGAFPSKAAIEKQLAPLFSD